jgi:PAS domain-containing protein
MKEGNKTKKQLINELIELRKLIAESQTSITERKRADETLRLSEENYRRLANSVNKVIYRADAVTFTRKDSRCKQDL